MRSASADFRTSPKSLFKSSSGDIRGSLQKSSSAEFRSSSAEPEFLRFWLEKDRAINKVDMRSKKQLSATASPSDKGKYYQMAFIVIIHVQFSNIIEAAMCVNYA